MTFYIDIIFLENIIMNYIILFATGLIIQKKINHIKIILSSIIGASYAIMLYITQLNLYSNQLIKFILSIVMLYIGFKPNDIKKMCKFIVIFYLTSFCFGGAAYYLLYNVSPEQIQNINGIMRGDYPLKIAVLGGILGFFIIYIAFKLVKRKIDKNSIVFEMEIGYNMKKIILNVLLDTGNLLVEPITGLPVVIVESEKLEELVDKKSIEIMSKGLINQLDELETELKTRSRIIPFSTVGKKNGMMIGFRPDYIKIYNEEEKTITSAIVGVCENKIGKNKNYSGLIGLELLNSKEGKTGDINEYNSNVKAKL